MRKPKNKPTGWKIPEDREIVAKKGDWMNEVTFVYLTLKNRKGFHVVNLTLNEAKEVCKKLKDFIEDNQIPYLELVDEIK